MLTAVAPAAATREGRSYHSTIFKPAFTLILPSGWTVAERDVGGAQIYRACATCAGDGEEHGEVTLDMSLASVPAAKAVRILHQTAGLKAGAIHSLALGSLHGPGFTAWRTGSAIQFPRSGYGTEPRGAALEVVVVQVGRRTVTIFLDPHTSLGERAQAFMAAANAILKSVRFAT